MEHILLRTFQPLKPEDDADERVGWCVVGSVLDLEATYEKVFYNEYLNLGLRLDRFRIPSAVLKAHLEEATRDYAQKTGRDRLSKAEKDELKFRVRTKLRKRVLPSMKLVDLSWNLNTGVAWFWSHSTGMLDKLEVLFDQTFGLDLDVDSPYLAALELGLKESKQHALQAVQQSPFHGKR